MKLLNRVSRKSITVLWVMFWATCLWTETSAQSSQLWGDLQKGKYNVGFTTFFEYDRSRPPLYEQGVLSAAQRVGRPMQINVWYPSMATGEHLSIVDYLKLTAKEVDFSLAVDSIDDLVKIVQQEQMNSHGIELNAEGLTEFLKSDWLMEASFDLDPASGNFPLIIIGPETGFKWCVMGEYLASHGYVVVTTPITGSSEKLPDFERTLFEKESFVKADEAAVTDLQFATAFAKSLPYVDGSRIGLSGYSSNIGAGIGMITRGIEVDAIVSLEGNIGGYIGGEILSLTPFYSPYEITQPSLHFLNPAFGSDDFWIQKYKYGDRTVIATYDIRHEHLSTYGLLNEFVPSISGETRNSPKLAIETTYNYALNFFYFHLKGDREAEKFINRELSENNVSAEFQNGVEPKWTGIMRLPALKSYDEHELNALYVEHTFDHVQDIYDELLTANGQPFSKSTFFNFGRFLKSTEEKEIWYGNYVECYPNFSEPYFLLAQEKQRLKKKDEAVKNYEMALLLFEETDHTILEDIFSRVINGRLEKLKE